MRAPQPLDHTHDLSQFDCGEPALNEWLKRRAFANQVSGASRIFVLTGESRRVLAYYALSAGAVARVDASGTVRRNMPDPIPVLVLGRLAVDLSLQGRGVGRALLKDAVLRAVRVAENAGVRAMLVHALHEKSRQFYLHHGFQPSPLNPHTLMLRLPGPA